ncbi:MAG: V-type ATPase subunit [Candidatus Bathyarchaeota archaeon]|uniref:V-type ATPase subunit n=1 Tax=Candidatus Bathycorpusculum sp. TaxID=2994959 RepID=UPI00282367C6|nr:V-type ATPase subunit [Candidatus Termiticorpusculum sp.]MCL2257458.1 V-type ATPase subunit [Candidatus Termiticorpusculum sp.]MCL2292440.1 V-type ATPase subunit [Candidatus Termiticorpusculum sp.]
MVQTKNYAQVLPKIGVARRGLLSEVEIKSLSESKSLSDFVAQLRGSDYQEQISKLVAPFTPKKLERVFNENLVNTYLLLIKNLPKNVRPFFELYLERLQIEHIKMLLKATLAKMSFEEKLAKIYLSVENYFHDSSVIEEAAKASIVSNVVSVFKRTPYYTSLNEGLKKYDETGHTVYFDLLLDRQYFDKYYSVYKKLPKKEQPYAKFYASLNVDGFLLFTILRGKTLGYDPDWLKVALPDNYFNISEHTLISLIYAIDYDAALKIITTSTEYKTYFTQTGTPEETISHAEKAFKNALIQHAKSRVFIDVFNIGAPLSFITLKEANIHNLTTAAINIYNNTKN